MEALQQLLKETLHTYSNAYSYQERKSLWKAGTSLAGTLGINHNSTQKREQLYEQGGLNKLLHDHRDRNAKMVITEELSNAIKIKLSSSKFYNYYYYKNII